jgi:hypothetical protein
LPEDVEGRVCYGGRRGRVKPGRHEQLRGLFSDVRAETRGRPVQ